MHVVRPSAFRSRSRSLLALFAATPLLAGAVQAQSTTPSDSAPFRPGQYGVEFGIGGNFGSLGLLRFSTPQRAMLFDVQGRLTSGNGDQLVLVGIPNGQVPVPRSDDAYELSARLGMRWYRPIAAQVQRFLTFGVIAQAARQQSDVSQLTKLTVFGGGGFVELGAAWMVTHNLSLGAAWNAEAVYARTTSSSTASVGTGSIEVRRSVLSLGFGRIGVRGNVYF